MADEKREGEQGRTASFDPRKHLIKTKGQKLYLPVAARILWLTTDREDGGYEITVTSEVVHYSEQRAVVKSTVTVPGRGTATGIKSETQQGFPGNYLEKAQTGSVGRALAILGYGTEYALELWSEDMQDGGEVSAAVDTPREPPATKTVVSTTAAGGLTTSKGLVEKASAALEQAAHKTATLQERRDRANAEIKRLAKEHGYPPPTSYGALVKLAQDQYGYALPKVASAAQIPPDALEKFVARMKELGGDPAVEADKTAEEQEKGKEKVSPFEQAPQADADPAREVRYQGAVSDLRRALDAYTIRAQLDDVIKLVHDLLDEGCLRPKDAEDLEVLYTERLARLEQSA